MIEMSFNIYHIQQNQFYKMKGTSEAGALSKRNMVLVLVCRSILYGQ